MGLDLVEHVIHDHLAGECLAVAPEGFKHLLMDTPQHHFGVGIYICTIRLHAHNCRRCVSTGLLKYTEGCEWTLCKLSHGVTADPVRRTATREREPVREQTAELVLTEVELVRGDRELK